MSLHPSLSGFILAGGQSRRMGVDKALLELDGQPLILRAANLLKTCVDVVSILGPEGRYEFTGIPVIPDRWPDHGPLAAMLDALENSETEWNIFLACDLPLLDARFIKMLVQFAMASKSDAVVPRIGDRWHPLCAAYRQTCIAPIRRQLEKGAPAVRDALRQLRVDEITSERLAAAGLTDDIFENINSPEDWRRLRRMMRV